jgi:hypothetical protein
MIVVQQRDPWAAAIAIMRNWQSAWRPAWPGPTDFSARLTGESLVMLSLGCLPRGQKRSLLEA